MPDVRQTIGRANADGRLPVLLRVSCVQGHAAAEGGRLLRVLLVWHGAVSARTAALLLSWPRIDDRHHATLDSHGPGCVNNLSHQSRSYARGIP